MGSLYKYCIFYVLWCCSFDILALERHLINSVALYQLLICSNVKEEITNSIRESKEDTFDLLLQEIMIKTLGSYNCVVIITDSIYSYIFEKSWFSRFGDYISFIVVIVEESDDLLAPINDTQNSLMMAKNDGCQMYVILISNGLETGRLLKFGDRYRILDTRSNYVLLFDKRLFDRELLYIWKKIINVLFIKKYSSQKPDGSSNKRDWYELTTVPFPVNFDDVLVPRRVDIWTKSKFRKGAIFFKDKTSDLKNQTLRVAAFSHIPGTVRTNFSVERTVRTYLGSNNDDFFSGTEIEILGTISKLMNFQCELYEPENGDVELWGRKEVGGIYTGILGEMTTARADLALGDLYYIPFVLNIMDLSTPYNTECLTFLTPEALTDISWKTLILPFSAIMWTCVILFLVLSSVAFYLLARFHRYLGNIKKLCKPRSELTAVGTERNKMEKLAKLAIHSNTQITKMDTDMKYSLLKDQYNRTKDGDDPVGLYQFSELGNSILYTYSMLLLVSLPKLPTGWSLRVLTGWYWLYCLLLVVAYRASMTAILSKPTPRVRIDSVQELIDSKLTYGGWGEINSEFFKASPDTFIGSIRENFEIVNDSGAAVDRVARGSFAFYENTYFLKEAILKRRTGVRESSITNKTNTTRTTGPATDKGFHIMKDCIINMPVSIGLQKNSPIKPRVDKIVRRVLEAGLVAKWLNDVMQNKNGNTERPSQGQKALMDLKKMYGALVALGVGYILGFLALFGEIFYFQYFVKKNPKFRRILYHIKKAN